MNKDIKFITSEILEKRLITSFNRSPYVIENGYIIYEFDGYTVEFQNGQYFLNGDYNLLDPNYYVYSIEKNGELFDIEDLPINTQEKINDLEFSINENCDTDVNNYTFTIVGNDEYNFNETIAEGLQFDEIEDKYFTSDYLIFVD